MRPWRLHEAVDEPGAGGVDVERAAAQAELVLHRGRGGGHGAVGRGGGEDEGVDRRRVDARHLERLAARLDREADGGAADVALVDAGALDDPLVDGVDRLLEVVVGDHLRRQRGAPAGDDGAADVGRDWRACQTVLSQAMGWRSVTRSPSTAM